MATFGNYATWNPLISEVNSSRAYADGNRKVTLNNADDGAETTMFVPAGSKGYCEITVDTNAAAPTVGIRRSDSQTPLSSTNLSGALEYGYRSNGQKRGGGASAASYGNTFTAGDVIGVAIDTVAGAVWFSKNGTWQASATIGEVNAGTTTNAAFTGLAGFGYTFAVANSSSGTTGDSFTGNFGAIDFAYTQPTGFIALSTANLPEPAVINPDEHYFSKVVDHDGSSTATTCTFNLENFEWLAIIKNTTGADEKWYWINSLRGVNKYIQSNDNDAEATDANVLTVSGTTFTLGSTLSDKDYYVEIHKAGLASAKASNTTGSINTIATSANTVSGFSLVEYTGNGTAGATIGHGLSVAPEYLFCKQMNASDGNLDVFHTSLGGAKRLFLQTTAAVNTSAAGWNNTAPSSSVITLGDGYGTNKNNVIYVAYVWHGVEGYSKMGSWVANGNADGPFTNLGGSPQSMIIRDYVGLANWEIFSTAMSPTNPMVNEIFPNTVGDIGTNGGIDFTSTGIKVLNTGDPNNSGRSYIYGAFGLRPLTDGSVNQSRAR